MVTAEDGGCDTVLVRTGRGRHPMN